MTTGRLPAASLRLAVMDGILNRRDSPDIIATLWREDPVEVTAIYDALAVREAHDAAGPMDGRHGMLAERMRELHRPLVQRRKHGLQVCELAEMAGVDRETMARALEHHGVLELVPFDGTQRRRLLTDAFVAAGYGHNVDPSGKRIAHLEGHHRAAPFPVIYPEHAASILWLLDFDGIRSTVATMARKRDRLAWLLTHHGFPPNAFIASLAGYSEKSVERARVAAREHRAAVRTTRPKGDDHRMSVAS